MMRIAIVGCGWVAGTQIETGFALLPDLYEIVACCDIDAPRLAAFADKYAIPRRTTRFDEILAMPDVEAISICTPPSLHYEMVCAGIAAGKHVLCEKPFTSSLALMDEVIARQQTSPARIMPIFQYRFGPGFARMQAIIRSGIAGRLNMSSVETAWLRGPDYYKVPWRGRFETELGGVLLTQSIHIHDLFLCLAGPVDQVSAFKTTRINPIEVEDCAVASLRMRDGSLASLTATLGSARPVTRIRMCFENLTIERQCFDLDAPKPALEPWDVIARRPDLAPAIAEVSRTTVAGDLFFAGQFRSFHESIRTGRPFVITLEDARRALELITAMFTAAEETGVETLPIGRDHPRYRGWHKA